MKKTLLTLCLLLALSHQSWAAVATTWIESPDAVNATAGDTSKQFWASSGGTFTYDTILKNNGIGSWKGDSTAGNLAATMTTPSGIISDAGTRMSLFINISALPSVTRSFITVQNATPLSCFAIQIDATGKLHILGNNGTLDKTGTTVITPVTWYRVAVGYGITNTTTFTINLYLCTVGGSCVTEVAATGADGTLANTGTTKLIVGLNSPGANKTFNFQNLYIDNGTDNTDPGAGVVQSLLTTAKRPFANGTSNQWTTQIGAGGSGYGTGHALQTNERPLSETNGWSISTTTKQTEEYAIEPTGTGDSDLTEYTIVDYMGWVWAKNDSAADSPVSNIIVNGVTTAKTLTTSYALYTAVAGSTVYPSGPTAIGIDGQYTTNPHTWSLAEAGIVFAYNPVTTPSGKHRMNSLGVGN